MADYTFTVFIIHFAVVSIVQQGFPDAGAWWTACVIGVVVGIPVAEFMSHRLEMMSYESTLGGAKSKDNITHTNNNNNNNTTNTNSNNNFSDISTPNGEDSNSDNTKQSKEKEKEATPPSSPSLSPPIASSSMPIIKQEVEMYSTTSNDQLNL